MSSRKALMFGRSPKYSSLLDGVISNIVSNVRNLSNKSSASFAFFFGFKLYHNLRPRNATPLLQITCKAFVFSSSSNPKRSSTRCRIKAFVFLSSKDFSLNPKRSSSLRLTTLFFLDKKKIKRAENTHTGAAPPIHTLP